MSSRVLGVDYGEKKIGLAIGINGLVSPFRTLDYIPKHQLEEKLYVDLKKIIEEENIDIVVIGLPLIKDKETEMSKKVRIFGENIKKNIPDSIDVLYVNEFRSSQDAISNALNMNVSKEKRSNEHELSACEIIRRYFQESQL